MSASVRSDGDPQSKQYATGVPAAWLAPKVPPVPAAIPDNGVPKSQILAAAGFVLPPALIVPADSKIEKVCPTCGQTKPLPRVKPYAYEWYAFVRVHTTLQEFYNDQLGIPWADDRSRDDPESRHRRERDITVETAERYEALPPADVWPAGDHGS